MNPRPIESARNADLRLSHKALMRAALRAQQLAAQTGTCIVISRNGVIEQIAPAPTGLRVQQDPPPYGEPA